MAQCPKCSSTFRGAHVPKLHRESCLGEGHPEVVANPTAIGIPKENVLKMLKHLWVKVLDGEARALINKYTSDVNNNSL